MIVSVEELKAHLRIQQDAEDKLLENLLMQAQTAANDFCRPAGCAAHGFPFLRIQGCL